jgi:hypothetical protein
MVVSKTLAVAIGRELETTISRIERATSRRYMVRGRFCLSFKEGMVR